MGKGSRPRPFFVDLKEFDENWDKIFGPDSKESEADKKKEEKILEELDERNKPNKNDVH